MRIPVMMLLAMMWLGPAHAVQKPAPVYELQATGTIQIGPAGEVVEYQLDKGQPAAIENALARGIQQWRFEPILVDGQPVIAQTRMRLSIEAEAIPGADYQLRIANVWFGEPDPGKNQVSPPPYPAGAIRAGIGAKVLLVLQLSAQGTVEQVHVEQVSLDSEPRPASQADRWRAVFAQASSSAAKKWQFDISEMLADEPTGTSVQIPVEFSVSDTRTANPGANSWRSYIPGPRVSAPWIVDTAVANQDAEALKNGDIRSLDSHFKLKGEVIGSLL